jgi:hypothetical protein
MESAMSVIAFSLEESSNFMQASIVGQRYLFGFPLH